MIQTPVISEPRISRAVGRAPRRPEHRQQRKRERAGEQEAHAARDERRHRLDGHPDRQVGRAPDDVEEPHRQQHARTHRGVPSRVGAASAPIDQDEGVNANPTVLVIQHDLDTPLAALEAPLTVLGVRTVTWHALSQPEPPAGEFDGLIVLGGIVNPDGTDGDAPLDRERETIAEAHARGVPGARHLPRRAARRPGARRQRRSACRPARSAGCASSSTSAAARRRAADGRAADDGRARVAQLLLHAAGRRRAPGAQSRRACRPSAWARRPGACSSTSR